ncbi:MAG: hypothetical protein Q8P12_01755 [bacterium]|nr:hypothetical protein [bacterium]
MRKNELLAWQRQEKVARIAGIVLAFLGAVFGGWMASADPGASGITIVVSAWLLGAIGYFLGIILGGVLTAPKGTTPPS